MPRNLRMFKPNERTTVFEEPSRIQYLKEMVESNGWVVLKEEAESYIGRYQREVPKTVAELIGYGVGSIVRDVLINFIEYVEGVAKGKGEQKK